MGRSGKHSRTSGNSEWLAGAAVGAAAALAGAAAWRWISQAEVPDRSVRSTLDVPYGVADAQFLRAVSAVLPPPLVDGNHVEMLKNGRQIFPAMLEAIRSAHRTITLETFIYWSGRIGHEFARALADRARAGVRCHVMLDWFGSADIDPGSIHMMQDAGVEVSRCHRKWWRPGEINQRTHRKILVVDGQVGFTGGVGIADEWDGDAEDERHWRDNHYLLRGPAVAHLQSAFTDNWLKSNHIVFHDERYYPELQREGSLRCQVFQSSMDEGSESLRLMYLLSIGAARRSIRIATAYFVPDDESVRALLEARERGVDIEILVPGPWIDKRIVRHASRSRWAPLLDAGVRIFEYQPTMFHAKAMIVDDLWSCLGSPNFDNRSFRINDEVCLNVYDAEFAASQLSWFNEDLGRCREVRTSDLRRRGVLAHAADAAAGAISRQL